MKTCVHIKKLVHSGHRSIHNSQKVETLKCPSADKWIEKRYIFSVLILAISNH